VDGSRRVTDWVIGDDIPPRLVSPVLSAAVVPGVLYAVVEYEHEPTMQMSEAMVEKCQVELWMDRGRMVDVRMDE